MNQPQINNDYSFQLLAIADIVGWVEQSETQQQIDKAIMDLWNTVA